MQGTQLSFLKVKKREIYFLFSWIREMFCNRELQMEGWGGEGVIFHPLNKK